MLCGDQWRSGQNNKLSQYWHCRGKHSRPVPPPPIWPDSCPSFLAAQIWSELPRLQVKLVTSLSVQPRPGRNWVQITMLLFLLLLKCENVLNELLDHIICPKGFKINNIYMKYYIPETSPSCGLWCWARQPCWHPALRTVWLGQISRNNNSSFHNFIQHSKLSRQRYLLCLPMYKKQILKRLS